MKVLVLSNGCFSLTDSNGRTLAKLFQGFKKEDLAQFFVYGNPDFDICEKYYKVSDRDALNSFIQQKTFGGEICECLQESLSSPSTESRKKVRKTPFAMLLREIAWKIGRWKKSFFSWVEDFSPDAIFIFLGDNAFLCRLARIIAKKRNIPVYVYSTEDYVFKNYNYLTKKFSLFYPFFHLWIKSAYRKLQPYVKSGVFNTPLLAETYHKAYAYPCHCVFNRSDIEYIPQNEIRKPLQVSYLGNMGCGRSVPLVEISNALAEIVPGLKLNVYGNLPEIEEEKKLILEGENIKYNGFVSYLEVIRIIHESALLVHVEQNEDFYNKDLRYAFSTKIADSICSGTPLLMYASRFLAETDFLARNECAFIAETKEELYTQLSLALKDENVRAKVLECAKRTRDKYFLQDNALYNIMRESFIAEE